MSLDNFFLLAITTYLHFLPFFPVIVMVIMFSPTFKVFGLSISTFESLLVGIADMSNSSVNPFTSISYLKVFLLKSIL